jgi:PKD repeat protein
MDGNGNVMVVWLQGFRRSPVTDEVVNLDRVWATRYDAATDSWLPSPVVISNTGASSPRIGMDSSGNAIALWEEIGGTGDNPLFYIFANRYEPASGWIHPVGGPLGNGTSPQISMGSAGSAMAIWNDDGNIWARRFAPGSDWQAPQTISTGGLAENPQVAMIALGLRGYAGDKAMAVWQQGWVQSSIYACLWDSATGWHAPELIESGDGSAYDPQVAISAGNGVRVVWRQYDSPGLDPEYHIYANRFAFAANNGWEGEHRVESGDWWDAYNPQLAWDASGVAIAAWDDGLTASLSGGLIRTYVWDTWGAWGPPTASFTHSPVSPRVGQLVDFDASGSTDNNGSVVSYEWDFENDGPPIDATGVTATHTYTASGTHTILLRVTDNDGLTDETTRSISIGGLLPPVACFTFTPPSPQVGEWVSFDAGCSTGGDGPIVQYEWDFEDDGTFEVGGVVTTHTFTAPGTHTVWLYVTNSNGLTGETSQPVNVAGVGACCEADAGPCTDGLGQSECEAGGGVYQGDGTTCSPDPCPAPLGGACCFDSSCIIDIEEACQIEGGDYQGDGTTCTPNPCP